MVEVKFSIYMTNTALSHDYLPSSLHRHDTIFFSKMIHAADNTAATRCHCDHAVDPQQQEPMTVAAMPWVRFAAKIFLQITKYLFKWNEIWNVDSQGYALKDMNLSNQNIHLPSLGLTFNTGWQQPLPWDSRPQIDKSFWNFQSQNPWALDGFSTIFKY